MSNIKSKSIAQYITAVCTRTFQWFTAEGESISTSWQPAITSTFIRLSTWEKEMITWCWTQVEQHLYSEHHTCWAYLNGGSLQRHLIQRPLRNVGQRHRAGNDQGNATGLWDLRRSSHEIILPSGLHCKVATEECLNTGEKNLLVIRIVW